MSVRREGRASDDGYRSELLPGLRASADAHRLADEIGFSAGRLQVLASAPPDLPPPTCMTASSAGSSAS